MTERNREPICGFCWAYREIRQPLVFRPADGWWECPLCKARVINPTDDEASLRADLLRDYDPDPHRFEKTLASTRRLHGGGNRSSGRKRRKQTKARKYERPGTLA